MEPAANYAERHRARDAAVHALEGRASRISTARVVTAVVAAGLFFTLVWGRIPDEWWIAFWLLVIVFATLVVVHANTYAAKERVEAARRFYERGVARLDGTWANGRASANRAGALGQRSDKNANLEGQGLSFREAGHPYADDLDLLGHASLFDLLDVTETRMGEAHLAGLLLGNRVGSFPNDVASRQEAVKDLAPRLDFRENLSAAGAVISADRKSPQAFFDWAEKAEPLCGTAGHPEAPPGWLQVASFVVPVATTALLFVGPLVGLSRAWAMVPFVAGILLLRPYAARIVPMIGAASSLEQSIGRFVDMLTAIENESFEAPRMLGLKQRLASSGHKATREMKKLSRIVGFLEARNNEVFRFFVGPALLWDLHCAMALEKWRLRAGRHGRDWLDVIGEVEALASLAALAYERPKFAFAKLASSPKFVATNLGHPLIAEGRRVSNSVSLDGPGSTLVITGSNMSGKSTMLRAMGINAVLAYAGAPVCADALEIGPAKVISSMRIKDSLEHGVSHFYAEVEKLKRVLDLARTETTFFLLDEILHGTNSRERLIGARAVVRELVRCGSLGGVSTHDLGIGDLESELPNQVRNVHFQEQVEGDRMTFDYKLRDGVVTSSNALRLMRMVGIDVVPIDG